MIGMSNSGPVLMRSQLSAIATLRWRLFVNSLRTSRGQLELISRIFISIALTVAGLGGGAGMGFGAYYIVSQGKPEYLALLLWPVFFLWQLFPVAATAFTNNPDSSELLRFPLTYRSYFLIRLAYGSFDPATALGSLWLTGIFLGVSSARPLLLPWAFLVLVTFAAFNIFFMQMVFAWIERWLAQRRTREIMGVLFILLMLSFQLIGPTMQHFSRQSSPDAVRYFTMLKPVEAALPPGLAANAIGAVASGALLAGGGSFFLLVVFLAAVAFLLHLRLRAQFHGENLSEAGARNVVQKNRTSYLGWDLPGLPSSIAAVFEKEVRYLMRSGPMLLTLVMPIFMLVIFRLGPMSPRNAHHGTLFMQAPNMAFPGAAAYALLVLTNLIYNNFGADAGGIQFFFAAPTRFKQIVLGKNLTHAGILAINAVFAWLAVTYLYGRPALDVTVATLFGLLFAAPINFTVGNLLSIYSPKRVDFSSFGRQRASQLTVLISMGVQLVIVGIGAGSFWIARLYQNFWIAAVLFLFFAAISFTIYGVAMHYIDQIAMERREALITELCRA
jgi:ABC-2 type transport system permease protein